MREETLSPLYRRKVLGVAFQGAAVKAVCRKRSKIAGTQHELCGWEDSIMILLFGPLVCVYDGVGSGVKH